MTDVVPQPPTSTLGRCERTLRSVGRRFRMQDSEFDELVQEVRIRLWRAEERETGSASTASYVWRTAEAAAIDLFRRRRTREQRSDRLADGRVDVPVGRTPDPIQQTEERELINQVSQAVSELPESRRVPVRMHLAGYRRNEIANALGWSEPKTRNLIYRGLADLRALLLKRGIGPEGMA
ncbi:MAG: sigma-70 family RNA polymerase sigma factor [Gemmatimonadales bacterium]|nr:MAG: sigma-70 family RNA polymerase sigma factor [Gemmatimonadales bacterium]